MESVRITKQSTKQKTIHTYRCPAQPSSQGIKFSKLVKKTIKDTTRFLTPYDQRITKKVRHIGNFSPLQSIQASSVKQCRKTQGCEKTTTKQANKPTNQPNNQRQTNKRTQKKKQNKQTNQQTNQPFFCCTLFACPRRSQAEPFSQRNKQKSDLPTFQDIAKTQFEQQCKQNKLRRGRGAGGYVH